MKNICVYCGSKQGAGSQYLDAASALAKALTNRGIGLVYGGARVGLMGRIADTMLEYGGDVIGVIPQGLFDDEVTHRHLTELIAVQGMHKRKQKMNELADGFIAMPGGFGTLEELFEAITWSQIGIHHKPIGLLNVNGYYDGLNQFIDYAVSQEFIKPKHLKLYRSHADAAELITQLQAMAG